MPPSSHAPLGKPLKTRWPFWDWPLTKERKQNLGCYGGRGSGRPLPQHRRTQYGHNQKWPLLGQRAAQEIMASAPAWGSGHNTSVRVAEQPGPNQVLLGWSPVPEGLAASPPARARIPRDEPCSPWLSGEGATGDTHRPCHAQYTRVSPQARTRVSGAPSEPRPVWVRGCHPHGTQSRCQQSRHHRFIRT